MLDRTKAEAEFCGRVPLNQTNLIQPHGALVIVDKHTETILQCSENTEQFLGLPANTLNGKPLSQLISSEQIEEIKAQLPESGIHKLSVILRLKERQTLALIHNTAELIIMEVEELATESSSFVAVHSMIKTAITAITDAEDVIQACKVLARHLKSISGFDKVMIYRFDANWNGEVIAEAMEQDMESYLGFTFPASDIPKQAREMYKRNNFRFIPDINYQPVKLQPVINPLTGGFTDLTDTNLRSVAPVHIEYLRNMKVAASMSTRILRSGQLWGLIACHHKTPKFLPYAVCSVFELLSDIISNKVVSIETEFAYRQKSKQLALFRETMPLFENGNIHSSFQENKDEVLQLVSATGACLYFKRKMVPIGITPDATDLQDLLYWVQSRNQQGAFQTNHLAAVYDPADGYTSKASGLLVIPFNDKSEDCIFAFRPEVVQEVRWGGNPDEAVLLESDGRTYHPRQSFKQWKEQVRQQAVPWTAEEVEIGETFGAFLNTLTIE